MTQTIYSETVVRSLKEAVTNIETRIKDIKNAGEASRFAQARVIRLEQLIENTDLLSWLNSQPHPVKIYWMDREDGSQKAGVGCAHSIGSGLSLQADLDQIQKNLEDSDPNLQYFGGLCFDPTNLDSSWSNFGPQHFILPRFEIHRTDRGPTCFACNIFIEGDLNLALSSALDDLFDLNSGKRPLPTKISRPVRTNDQPPSGEWDHIIQDLLKRFESEILEKVVLARKITLSFEDTPNVFSLLQHLTEASQKSYIFLFQFREGDLFFGASPERFYKRTQGEILTEAIAGTRPRGETSREDLAFKQELLGSPKESREHALVVESIRQALTPFLSNIQVDSQTSVLELNRNHHLMTRISGQLTGPDLNDSKIVEALHPTAAVGGYPLQEALAAIRTNEPFSRGWYAAPVGYVGRDTTEFAVAIRSGRLTGKRLELYAGAGIVTGSTPRGEWLETEHKFNDILQIFNS